MKVNSSANREGTNRFSNNPVLSLYMTHPANLYKEVTDLYNIYKITCDVTNKIYIGCTTKPIEVRLKEHYEDRNKHGLLHEDMKKFDISHFSVELIETGNNDAVRYQREKFYIKKFDSMNPDIGYNMTIGGLGTVGYQFTEKDREKISKAGIGRKPSKKTLERIGALNRGKHLSDSVKQKISQSRKGKYTKEDNPFYGKHHTEQTKNKIRQIKKEHGILKPVIGINVKTGEQITFDSLTDAGRYCLELRGGKLDTLVSHIQSNILGRYNSKSAYGFKWSYIKKSNDYLGRE